MGYRGSTDNPETPYEIIDNALKVSDEQKIYEAAVEFREEVASWFFNTSEWDDYWWDAWIEKFKEVI